MSDDERRRICAVPGCDSVLSPRCKTGVCRAHNHWPECQCEKCRILAANGRAPTTLSKMTAPRVPVRTVLVPYRTKTLATATLMEVSLPRMPWDGDDVQHLAER